MSRPIVKIHNASTGEIVEREMNNAEFAQYEKDQIEALEVEAKVQAKIQAKAELLERLGITEDEAKLLLA